MLPDEVLLAIFDSWVDEDAFRKKDVEAWQMLVHVCRRWRSVVFGSPRRLNLRLVCGAKTPAMDTLDVWPPLPLIILCPNEILCEDDIIAAVPKRIRERDGRKAGHYLDNIIAVLKRSDRVCQIDLSSLDLSSMTRVLSAMQQPFPELTDLRLDGVTTAIPDSFLGGSALRLRKLHLGHNLFSGLPKLLFSATHLVDLQLGSIYHSRSFSLEAMITALSTLTSIRHLSLEAENRYTPYLFGLASLHPLPTRSLLPVLNTLRYYGISQYFDDLVTLIDAPRLNNLDITLLNDIALEIPQLTGFIGCTSMPEALKKAHVTFQVDGTGVKFSSQTSSHGELKVKIPCRGLDVQLSFLYQVFSFCLPPLSTSEDLYIYENIYPRPVWSDNIENTLWLELLLRFPAVKNLYLSKEIASYIALALQELVVGTRTEVLPILQNIFLEGLQLWGPVPEGIEQFIAARQLSGRPIAVSAIPLWERDSMRGWVMEFGFE